jgi:tetratricopeptide (TPR) repeat protein
MREFVFPDPSLTSRAGQFVWLAINTEDEKNAPFLVKFPGEAVPTFAVLDPKDESVVLRLVGSMTVPQLHAFLDNARIAVAGGGGSGRQADETLRAADQRYGRRQYSEAAEAYRLALGQAPAEWPPYGRAVEALLYSYQQTSAHDRCVELAQSVRKRLAGTPSELNAAAAGLDCALALKDDTPDKTARVADMEAEVRRLVADPKAAGAADDVSGAYGSLLDARRAAKDEPGARRTAEDWATYLEGAAARAQTPGQRSVFDSHRLAVYLELKQPERAIPMLEASERDFPQDYNPPARLAAAYQAMKEWDKALAAADRALLRLYGPRKLRVLDIKAEVLKSKGDLAGARRTLQEAVAFGDALPPGQRSESRVAGLRKKLESWTAPSPPPSPPPS